MRFPRSLGHLNWIIKEIQRPFSSAVQTKPTPCRSRQRWHLWEHLPAALFGERERHTTRRDWRSIRHLAIRQRHVPHLQAGRREIFPNRCWRWHWLIVKVGR